MSAIKLNRFLCLLMGVCGPMFLVAQDSPCLSLYKEAGEMRTARQDEKAISLAREAAACYQREGDTLGWCKSLDLEANATKVDFERAIAALDSALDLYRRAYGDTTVVYFRLLSDRATKLGDYGRWLEAIGTDNDLTGMFDAVIALDSVRGVNAVFLVLLQQGERYSHLGMLARASEAYRTAFSIVLGREGVINTRILGSAHASLSQNYERQRDLPRAAEENRIAVRTFAPLIVADGIARGAWFTARGDYAVILKDRGYFQEAIDTLHVVLAEMQADKRLSPVDWVSNIANLGHLHMRLGNLDSAMHYTQAARMIYANTGPGSTAWLARMDINLSGILRKKGQLEAARSFAQSAIDELEGMQHPDGSIMAKAWIELALVELESGELEVAIKALHRALLASAGKGASEQPMEVRVEEMASVQEYFHALKMLGQISERRNRAAVKDNLRVGKDPDLRHLRLAWGYYSHGLGMLVAVDNLRMMYGEPYYHWEVLWRDNYEMIEATIRVSLDLHRTTGDRRYLYFAMGVSDMSKGRQIGKNAEYFGREAPDWVPSEVKSRERELVLGIQAMRALPTLDSTGEHTLDQFEEAFRSFKDSLALFLPRYHNLRYERMGDSIRVIRALLQPVADDQLVLEYFVGKERLYAFLRGPGGLMEVAEIPDRKGIEELVARHRSALDGTVVGKTEQELAVIGMELSRRLFPFSLPPKNVRRLLVVPDGFLYKVSFAALVRHDAGWLPDWMHPDVPYWVRSVAIGYDFSYAAHLAASEHVDEAGQLEVAKELIAHMEFELEGEAFFPLETSQAFGDFGKEAGLEMRQGLKATRGALIGALEEPSVVALLAHGFGPQDDDGRGGFMMLEDSLGLATRLYASELYALPQIGNRLLLLNSCQGASGDYLWGEGALSMTRGFRQAGCPAVLSNLWEGSTVGNEQMLETFWKAVGEGRPLDVALQEGQLAALRGEDQIIRHPSTWAVLCLYGAEQPLKLEAGGNWTLYVVLGVLALALGLWVWREWMGRS